jgi:hypothetical protein
MISTTLNWIRRRSGLLPLFGALVGLAFFSLPVAASSVTSGMGSGEHSSPPTADQIRNSRAKVEACNATLAKYTSQLETLKRQKPQAAVGQKGPSQLAMDDWSKRVADLETKIRETKEKLATAKLEWRNLTGKDWSNT